MTCPFWADLLANYSLALGGRYLHGGGLLFFCNDARARYGINTHIIVLESSISSLVLLPSRIYSSARRSLVLKRLTFLPSDAGTCTASHPPSPALSLGKRSQDLRGLRLAHGSSLKQEGDSDWLLASLDDVQKALE